MNKTINDLNDSQVSRLLRQIKDITFDELYDEMRSLKSKVLGLLKDYSQSLSQKENARQLNKQIKADAQVINEEYSVILDKFNQSVDISIMSIDSVAPLQKQEKEMNNMFNLIEEFLEKFTGKKPQQNLFTSYLSDRLSRSGISRADISVLDVNQRIEFIKSQLQENLQNKKYSQIIILETMEQLEQASRAEKIDNIKSIITRIESTMKNLEDDTSELYQLLTKALEQCREKEEELVNRSIVEDKDLKRKFFDIALQIKSDLPKDHQGRKVLVSMLFEEAQDIPEKDWYQWITNKLNN
ncbi:hypothetical protein pb186bvf_009500 [Paramecium bursaria]